MCNLNGKHVESLVKRSLNVKYIVLKHILCETLPGLHYIASLNSRGKKRIMFASL